MSLEAKDVVSGYFKEVDILHGLSIRSEKSRLTSVIGPNGSGKSTLLKTVYGFLKMKNGQVFMDGQDITGTKPSDMLKMGIAYAPQDRGTFPYMTIEKNLMLGGWTIKGDKKRLRAAMEKQYTRFPFLKDQQNKRAGLLSGGQLKILEIAKSLITDPTILLVDEPTAGLAPIAAKEVYDALEAIKREGRTILLVDQNVRKAVQLGDYVYVLELGKVKAEGAREEFEEKLKEIVQLWGFGKDDLAK